MIYIREAHPEDGWFMSRNRSEGISVADPKTIEDRKALAGETCSTLRISIPCLVDTIDDTVNLAYDAWPERIYVIDTNRTVALAGAPGPFGFAPAIEATDKWLSGKTG